MAYLLHERTTNCQQLNHWSFSNMYHPEFTLRQYTDTIADITNE